MTKIFIRDQEVADIFGTSRAWPWRKLKSDPTFPKPVQLSPKCVRWRAADIAAWASQTTQGQTVAPNMLGAA